MSDFKVRIALCIVFLAVFGLYDTSWGLAVGLEADAVNTETTHTTRTIDTDDMKFYLRPTKRLHKLLLPIFAFTISGASATIRSDNH